MSISGESTVAPSRDLEGSHKSLDGEVYGFEGSVISSLDKSPYANAQIVSLEVGLNATRFDVHGTILQQSTELAAKFDPWSLKKVPVPLPEIDEATAHTLVHYLYTGKYQALGSESESEEAIALDYKLGTCAYCAAIRYKLPGLVELAREKITSFGEDVSIFDILAVAKDHAFPMLPEDELWYSGYVESAINGAMAENPEPFRKPDFITQVEGNSRLLQVVWKTVMSSYARTPVASVNIDDEVVTPTAEKIPDITESAESQEEEPTIEDRILVDELEAAEVVTALTALEIKQTEARKPITVEIDDMQGDTLKLDEIEPTDSTPQAPEPFTDELGFESSKTYQQMGKKFEQVPETVATAALEATKSGHTRSDSVVEVEETVAPPELERKATCGSEAVDAVAGSPQAALSAIEGVTASKKSKKMKKKKATTFI
ncbi:hypothetical protein T440DRAFT_537022 [Plenodomus tracheiphilus IPT5]|uniref:BTB domain-containing protein n=1 Tax=Plenodomus tracheiphilus IPT5 TaxID=1408161 RepID=A0A6A7B0X1_9PLEO|nr:hypothetical protein T440DRAFT_537022 [Plenodomus tracheiphilus IPT5]